MPRGRGVQGVHSIMDNYMTYTVSLFWRKYLIPTPPSPWKIMSFLTSYLILFLNLIIHWFHLLWKYDYLITYFHLLHYMNI
jgi:hypothetical protein